VRHSISLPIFITALVVLHPVMKQKLPLFRVDILRTWRTYVSVALIAAVTLIEGS
jgi:hypothetical protein